METVTVVAENFIKAECVEAAMPLFEELVAKTRLEDGCISYTLYVDKDDSSHMIFFEQWTTQAALDAHTKSAHFTAIVPQIRELSAKPGTFLNGFAAF